MRPETLDQLRRLRSAIREAEAEADRLLDSADYSESEVYYTVRAHYMRLRAEDAVIGGLIYQATKDLPR